MWFMKYYHNKSIWLILFILWTLLILLVSLIPYSTETARQSISEFRWDYLEHFLAYFAFGSFYVLWRSDRNFSMRSLELALMFAVTISFSLMTEYLQLLVPGRRFNLIDAAYNLAGVLGSILLVYFYLIRHFMRKRQSAIKV